MAPFVFFLSEVEACRTWRPVQRDIEQGREEGRQEVLQRDPAGHQAEEGPVRRPAEAQPL